MKEDGVALIVAMMAMLLMSGLGLALVATTSSEAIIAANFRSSVEVAYAADAIAGRAMADLHAVSDWTTVLTGATTSTFVDGAPAGLRTLADGTTINLTTIVNLANCNRTTACSAAAMDAVTAARPWGGNNPRWQLYAFGELGRLLPAGTAGPPSYLVAMVADDPAERDGDPLQDAADPGEPGAGVLMLRVEAFAARGAHKRVEVTLAHPPAGHGMRLVSWRP